MTEEINKLIAKGKRSLKAAEQMIKMGDYDFAVSRIYYSCFYLAEALLLTQGKSFSKHTAIISGFYECFVKTKLLPQKLHQTLHQAYGLRQEGDYSSDECITKDTANEMLTQSKGFIEQCEVYLRK